MKLIKLNKTLLSCLIAGLFSVAANAETVTEITIENVGYGGQNDYHPPESDPGFADFNVNDIDAQVNVGQGYSGAFAFNNGSPAACDEPGCGGVYYGGHRLGLNGGGAPRSDHGLVFRTDVNPIDASQANLVNRIQGVSIESFTTGFNFVGLPFVPQTTGPIVADISIISASPQLNITSLPWSGVFGSLNLDPQFIGTFPLGPQATDPADCAGSSVNYIPLTVRWLERVGNTDKYYYRITWTHCITIAEDDLAIPATVGTGGNGFGGQRPWFTLEGIMTAPDTTPPTVLSSIPSDGSTTHPINNAVSIQFSEEMDPATVNTASFTVTTGGGATVCASITTTDNITFTCNPTGGLLALSTTYDINVSTAVTDSAVDNSDTSYVTGVAMAAAESRSFTTSVVDAIQPNFVSSNPASGATGIAANSTVDITFSDNSGSMAGVTSQAISVSTSGSQITGNTATSDNLTYSFTPDAPLLSNTLYTVNIDGTTPATGAQDSSSNLLSGGDVVLSFTTAKVASLPFSPVTGEPVVSVNTTAGASMVSLDVVIPAQIGGTLPDRVVLDSTFVDYTVNAFTDGQAIVTIDFGFDFMVDDKLIYKFNGTTFVPLVAGTDYVVINNSTIQMTISDNDGVNDLDTATGAIQDKIGTGIDLGPRPVPGSISGCSTVTGTKVSPLERADIFLLIGLVLVFGYARKRSGVSK